MASNSIKIILDSRESKLIKHFENHKSSLEVEIEVKQLDVADIVCSDKVGIERKEAFDFVISLTDSRLFEQLKRLKDAYEYPLIILEDFSNFVLKNVGVRKSSIYGSFAYVSYKMGIPLIPSCSIADSALIIERIAFREQIKDQAPVLARSAPKGMNEYERRCFILEGLNLCGPEKARILIEHFETPEKVFKAIKHTDILYTRNGNPKGIQGPLDKVEKISVKFVEYNKSLLFGEELENKISTKHKNLGQTIL